MQIRRYLLRYHHLNSVQFALHVMYENICDNPNAMVWCEKARQSLVERIKRISVVQSGCFSFGHTIAGG